jgi:futalosine hydrolase
MKDSPPKDTVQNPIALICSVDLELRPLVDLLEDLRPFACGGRPAWIGRLGDRTCIAMAGGMGKTNAAQAATALLERTTVAALIGFGVGGAYLRGGLNVGDVAIATSEIYGDEGVESPAGWMSTEGIGIPLLDTGTRRCFNEFSIDNGLAGWLTRGVADRYRVGHGPFVTVSCCSGTQARGDALAERFGAICETMEGAAYAHVAALYSVPFAEIRGISNLVTDRDMSSWRLSHAAEIAATVAATSISLPRDPAREQPASPGHTTSAPTGPS